MTKYHDIVFEVIKINNNTLDVKDPDGNIYHPKKIFCKKINNVVVHEVNEPVKNINKKLIHIGKENKQTSILKKEDMKEDNILDEKRERKANSLYFWN